MFCHPVAANQRWMETVPGTLVWMFHVIVPAVMPGSADPTDTVNVVNDRVGGHTCFHVPPSAAHAFLAGSQFTPSTLPHRPFAFAHEAPFLR